MTEGDGASTFTLREVFADAFARLRATWSSHFAWNAVFLWIALVSCCGAGCLFVPLAGMLVTASPQPEGSPPPPALVAVMYVLFAVTTLALATLHESVTLHIATAPDRAEPASMRSALDATLRRAPALLSTVVVRTVIDVVPPTLLVSFGAAIVAFALEPGSTNGRTIIATGITIAYFASLAWALFSRSHFGLALSSAMREGLGPRAALERSHVLLRGHRWHFLAFRLAYFVVGFGFCGLASSPLIALLIAMPQFFEERHDGAMLVIGPLVIVGLGLLLALFAIDTVLVAAYHARLARPLDAEALAKVFD